MAGEIDLLLKSLRELKDERKTIANSKDVWSKIGQRDFIGAGFASEEEAQRWIELNPYLSL